MGVPHYFRYYYRHGLSGIINLSPVAVYNIYMDTCRYMYVYTTCTRAQTWPRPGQIVQLVGPPDRGRAGGGGCLVPSSSSSPEQYKYK